MTSKKRYKTLSKGQDPISILIGNEPIIENADQIMGALNWYRNILPKLYPKYIGEYMKGKSFSTEEINRAIKGPKKSYEYFAAAAYGRMSTRGAVLPADAIKSLNAAIEYLLAKNPVKTQEAPRVNVQDNIREKANRLISSIEEQTDRLLESIQNNKKFSCDLVEWFKKNEVKAAQAEYIQEHFEKHLTELNLALDGSDPDMSEGYSFISKPNLRKYAKFHAEIVTLAKEQIVFAKSNRKTRKKKQKTPEQLVSKIVYMKEFLATGLSIKSINPEEIIGADRLVVYNTKTAIVAVYSSSELSNGFTVKGSKILNFDTKTSTMKKVRDPKKSIPKFLGGLRAINNAYGEIKTKEKPVNGKINEYCIILQAITK